MKFEKLNEQDEVRHSLPIFSGIKEDMTKERRDNKIKGKGVGCSSTILKPGKLHEIVRVKVELKEGKEEYLHKERKTLKNLIQITMSKRNM